VRKCVKKGDLWIALFSLLKKGNDTFSMIALFKVQKRCDFKIRTFLHILTHSLIWKERLCDHTFFALFQRAKKVRSHICTFLKSDKMCNRTFAHFQRAKMCDVRMCECAIAQLCPSFVLKEHSDSLFFGANLSICSFFNRAKDKSLLVALFAKINRANWSRSFFF